MKLKETIDVKKGMAFKTSKELEGYIKKNLNVGDKIWAAGGVHTILAKYKAGNVFYWWGVSKNSEGPVTLTVSQMDITDKLL